MKNSIEESMIINVIQHNILRNIIADCKDSDLVEYVLENIDSFKFGDYAIKFWNRCVREKEMK